jgi:hypothetical protein
MTDIVKRLRQPPFGTETSERNIMTEAADEIDRLRNALKVAVNCMDGMVYDAYQIGLEGSSDWDRTAGNRNIHGAIDQGRKVLFEHANDG